MELDPEGKVFGTIYINFHEVGNVLHTDKEIDRVCDKLDALVEKIEALVKGNLCEELDNEPLTAWVTTSPD